MMVELYSKEQMGENRRSSKGNQLKFTRDGIWYKADYLGYEGLAEYVISRLLDFSNLSSEEFVSYDLVQIRYHDRVFNGCSSADFLRGWNLITLERLFQQVYGYGVNQLYLTVQGHKARLQTLVDRTEQATGLRNFGEYMSKMLTIDTLFLNEDRHAHNIAIMMNDQREFRLAPFFDQGAGLLSDTTLDYPMDQDPLYMIGKPKPKSFCNDFDEQIDIAEELYGSSLRFRFGYREVQSILDDAEEFYSGDIRRRVADIMMQRRRKYEYLFTL